MSKCAVLQMVSGRDIQANLEQAERLLKQAAAGGAQLAVLPENFAAMGGDMLALARAEQSGDGPIFSWLAQQAKNLGLWIVAGSLPLLQRADDSKPAAACLVFDDQGQQRVRYDKLHLFDAAVADGHGQYRESDSYNPGHALQVIDTPVGRLGLSICYDLRFAGLYSALRDLGAELISVPSAFTKVTGEAHWEVLLRARAIENQCYVLAANQGGRHGRSRETYGHSMIIDPWGEVLASAQQGEQLVLAEVSAERLQQVRQSIPVCQHQRLSLPQLINLEAKP